MSIRMTLATLAIVVGLAPALALADWEHMAGKTMIANFDFKGTQTGTDSSPFVNTCKMEWDFYVSREGNLFSSATYTQCSALESGGAHDKGIVYSLTSPTWTGEMNNLATTRKVTQITGGFRILDKVNNSEGDLLTTGTELMELVVDGDKCRAVLERSYKFKGSAYTTNLKLAYTFVSCRVVDGKR